MQDIITKIPDKIASDEKSDKPEYILRQYAKALFIQTEGLLQSDIFDFRMEQPSNDDLQFIGWMINVPILGGKIHRLMNLQFEAKGKDYPVLVMGFTGEKTISAKNKARNADELKNSIQEVLESDPIQKVLMDLWNKAYGKSK
jgi:hypothetical protein